MANDAPTPPVPAPAFDATKYPNAEAAFPGAAAAIHTLGGPKEAEALAALEKVGEGLGRVDPVDGKITPGGKTEAIAGNEALYAALNDNLKAIAAQQGGATAEQKTALDTLGGTQAVAAMSVLENGYRLAGDSDPDAKTLGQKKINAGNKMFDDAVYKKQGDAFVKAHPKVFSENTVGTQMADATEPPTSGIQGVKTPNTAKAIV